MNDWLEILIVFGLSAVKFGVAGVPAAVFAKFSFLKTVTVTCAGGLTGTIVFTYVSEWLINSYKKIKEKVGEKKATKPKKKFTRTNRLIVRVKGKFGLYGIAFLTPSVLSFPLGVFVAVRYYRNKQKVITFMAVSTFAWSVLLYFFYHNVYHKLSSFF